MFTLRIIHENGTMREWIMGDFYRFVCRMSSYSVFKTMFFKKYNEKHTTDVNENSSEEMKNVVGFILFKKSEEKEHDYVPIRLKDKVYVMIDGTTVNNLTYSR